MRAIITVGISASGKSTWAAEFVAEQIESGDPKWVILNRDAARRSILEIEKGRALQDGELWKLWKFKNENKVSELIDQQLMHAHAAQSSVIFSDTNLSHDRNDRLKKKLQALGYTVEFKYFPIDFMEAVRRDNGRADGVGMKVLYDQFLKFNDYSLRRTYVPNEKKPMAIMVDIDGTLAHMNGRSPFDWDKVDTDACDEIVATMVDGFKSAGYKIIVMSGRDSCSRELTEKWLSKHDIPYDSLFMRAENDMRKDDIVKEEMFWGHVADNYNVRAVIDDRAQVVRRWTELGLKVINVGRIHDEF